MRVLSLAAVAVFAAAASLAVPASGQTLPLGGGFSWDTLGTTLFNARFLSVSWEGEYWAGGGRP